MLVSLRKWLNTKKWYTIFNPFRDRLKIRFSAFCNGCRVEFGEKTKLIKGDRTIILRKNAANLGANKIYNNKIYNNFDNYYQQVRAENKTVDFSEQKKHYITSLREYFWIKYAACGVESIDGYLLNNPVKEGDVVIDLGAWCGLTVYVFSKLVGKTGKVYAFEPDSENYEILLKNIKLHNLDNVIPLKKGVYSFNGVASFMNSNVKSAINNNGNETIEVVRLDDFIKSIGKVDLVKADIEGAEIAVVESIKDYLKINKIRFSIASYHWLNGEQTYIKLEKIFKEIGYNVETDYPSHLTTWAN